MLLVEKQGEESPGFLSGENRLKKVAANGRLPSHCGEDEVRAVTPETEKNQVSLRDKS